ncbi:MAG: hypothetical protein ABL903_20340 [Methylococcales bacterium]
MNNFKPDFSHRLNSLSIDHENFTLAALADTLILMSDRALAVINLMAVQYDGDRGQFSDAINSAALDTVDREINDIKETLSAFLRANVTIVQDKTELSLTQKSTREAK